MAASTAKEPGWHGYVGSYEEVVEIIHLFSRKTGMTYVSGKKERTFNANAEVDEKSRVFFEDKTGLIPFDGVPFVFVGSMSRECMYGRQKNAGRMKKAVSARERELAGDHPRPKKKRDGFQSSKKKGCKASIIVKEILKFTQFVAQKNSKKVCSKISSQMRGSPLVSHKQERRFYMSLPSLDDHDKHQVTELTGLVNPVHKDLREEISRLVSAGVTSVSECRRHLKKFVADTYKDEMPKATNLAYYPMPETIRKHMYLAQQRLRYSQLDQESLLMNIAKWTLQYPEDCFTCIPSSRTTDNEEHNLSSVEHDDADEVIVTQSQPISTSFFFAHQSKSQRHLLKRCYKSGVAEKQNCIERLPKNLFVQLKRFDVVRGKRTKDMWQSMKISSLGFSLSQS